MSLTLFLVFCVFVSSYTYIITKDEHKVHIKPLSGRNT